MEYIIISS